MKVTVKELRSSIELLLQHLEETGHEEIEISHDYYWNLPAECRYNVHRDPDEMTIGQLSEDLENVTAIASGTRKPMAYALVWVANILRAVGEKVVR